MKTLRKMRSMMVISLLFFNYCTPVKPVDTIHYKTHPSYIIDPKPQKILLLNAYNVKAQKYRDNKEELFVKFIDSILVTSATEIKEREGIAAEVIKGFTPFTEVGDSSIYSVIKKHNASHAIVVIGYDASFDQTRVDVTKNKDGSKEREAQYDILCNISFAVYTDHDLFRKEDVFRRHYHSSRNVMSGLLAAGPNIVAQRKDAWKITMENLQYFLNLYFEGK